jgi:asparagine synthase (glutamine-hydrolysing)
MSGILGIWNLDGRPLEPELLAKMSATLAHRGPDGEGRWLEGPVGLACQLLRVTPESLMETQPLAHPAGTVVVFDGRLDNRPELLGLLKASPGITAASPDAALVLAAYDTFGERFPGYLNGDFALALFDPRRPKLLLARDAIGLRPLYYARTGDTFLFASEIKAILAHPQVTARPHDEVLAAFLLNRVISQDLQGSTLFTGVSSLLPAHLAILTPGGLVLRQYWEFDPSRRLRLRSFGEYAEAFRHHFGEAVRRRLRSAFPVAVAVSGGLDSSAIFCQAETLRRQAPAGYPPLLGLTYTATDGSPADESAYIREIERTYRLTIERVPLGPLGYLRGCREAVWHLEAPVLEEDLLKSFLRKARQLGPRVLLTGNWGDQVTFQQAYLVDLLPGLAWGQVWAHLQEIPRWFTDARPRVFWQIFLQDLVRHYLPAAVPWLRRLRPLLAPAANKHSWFTKPVRQKARRSASLNNHLKGGHASAYAKSLYHQSKVGYYELHLELTNKIAARQGLEMVFPFLDRELLAFLMGIPGEMAAWRGVPKAILRQALTGVLPEAIAQRKWKGDFTEFYNKGLARDFSQLVQILHPHGLAVKWGYLREAALREKLPGLQNRIQRPDCLVTWSLADLLGLELWLQAFFRGNPAKAPEGAF